MVFLFSSWCCVCWFLLVFSGVIGGELFVFSWFGGSWSVFDSIDHLAVCSVWSAVGFGRDLARAL